MKFDFTLRYEATTGEQVCDFCAAPSVYTLYDCDDFPAMDGVLPIEALHDLHEHGAVIEGNVPTSGDVHVKGVSKGAWSACKTCAELIDADHWHELLDRCIDLFIKNHPDAKPVKNELKRKIRDFHMEFRKLRRMAN